MFFEHKRLYDAFVFQKDAHPVQPGSLMMFRLSSNLFSPQTFAQMKQDRKLKK
jgi:hypothetical protein